VLDPGRYRQLDQIDNKYRERTRVGEPMRLDQLHAPTIRRSCRVTLPPGGSFGADQREAHAMLALDSPVKVDVILVAKGNSGCANHDSRDPRRA